MLHLHALVQLTGNLAFNTLHNQLLKDNEFATRVIRYLEAIIIQSIDLNVDTPAEIDLLDTPPSTKCPETDDEFYVRLSADSNAVACKKQIHLPNHNATCFKYSRKGLGKDACRFGMPRDLLSTSKVDELGVIHLARNHGWINPWNSAIASCIRSNYNISWILTVAKSLSLVYYITNYATKDNISPQQILLKAALLKRAIENAKTTITPDARDLQIQKKDMDQFALRCFNSLSHDREISGVQIASSLLQLPTYYTTNYNFVQINLQQLQQYLHTIIQPIDLATGNCSNPIQDKQCPYKIRDNVLVSRFNNYKQRSLLLAYLSFFEYCMLVQTKNIHNAIASDVEFDLEHSKSSIYIQRLAPKKSQVKTVTFSGQLS